MPLMQALLPEDPMLYSSITHNRSVQLPDWVVDETVAVYKSTPATLKAALQAYKDNVFLAVRSASLLADFSEGMTCWCEVC